MSHLFAWKDYIEIASFIFIFYRLINWLNNDKSYHLVHYFLGYCFIFGLSYYFTLNTLYSFMIMYTPILIICFIIFHQKTLQRAFITPCRIDIKTGEPYWIDIIISTALQLMNKGISSNFLIEQTDFLLEIVSTEYPLNDAPISLSLLRMLTHNPWYNPEQMIWITSRGTLTGINSSLIEQTENADLMITYNTDATILKTDIKNRCFSLCIIDHCFEKLTAEHAALLIKKHFNVSLHTKTDKGDFDEKNIKKQHTQQKNMP